MLGFFKTVFLGFLGFISSVPSYIDHYFTFKTTTFISNTGDPRYVFDVDAIKTRTVSKRFDNLNSDCALFLVNKQQGFSTRGGTFDFKKFVSIEGHDEDTCTVEAVIASPEPDNVTPDIVLDNNKISITTEYDNESVRGYVSYILKVPHATLIQLIRTNHGDIAVKEIDNSIEKAETMLGDITLYEIKGESHSVKTLLGTITAHAIEGNCIAHTSSGKITVDNIHGSEHFFTSNSGTIYAENIDGRCNANTDSGDVIVKTVVGNTIASTNMGNITLQDIQGFAEVFSAMGDINLEKLKKGIIATTSMGNIYHSLGNNPNLTISASTNMGSVWYCNQKQKRGCCTALLGKRKFKAQFTTAMGDVVISK